MPHLWMSSFLRRWLARALEGWIAWSDECDAIWEPYLEDEPLGWRGEAA